MNGHVVGILNAGLLCPYTNGELYFNDCGYAELYRKDDATNLVYGFDNTTNAPFAIEFFLL